MDDRALTRVLFGAPAVIGVAFVLVVFSPRLFAGASPDDAAGHVWHNSAVPMDLPEVVRVKSDFSDQEAVRRYFGRSLGELRDAEFPGLRSPSPGDWRSGPGRTERHQTFAEYLRTRPPDDGGKRRYLILRPVGRCPEHLRGVFGKLERFLAAFYDRPILWGEALPLPRKGLRMLIRRAGAWAQLPILPALRSLVSAVPDNGLAVLGVTCSDLYQQGTYQYLFGYGTLQHRAGICSMARMFPELHDPARFPAGASLGLLRALKLVAHETGHMLGLHHCARSQCVMNGINSLPEVDAQPLHLCPLCLSKLAAHLRFDVRKRYLGLATVLERLGQPLQAAWYRRQVLRLVSSPREAKPDDEEDALPLFRPRR